MAPGYESLDKSRTPFGTKLKKSIYGLRLRPKNWFGTMDDHLSNIGFPSLKLDPCVYAFEDKTNLFRHSDALCGQASFNWQRQGPARQYKEAANAPFRSYGLRERVDCAWHERHPETQERDDHHRPEGLHGGHSRALRYDDELQPRTYAWALLNQTEDNCWTRKESSGTSPSTAP